MAEVTLNDALEVAEELNLEDQEELLSILSRRLAEKGRARVIAHAREAQEEYLAGQCRVVSVQELMDEALQ